VGPPLSVSVCPVVQAGQAWLHQRTLEHRMSGKTSARSWLCPATSHTQHSQHNVNSPIRPHEKSKRCYQSELVQRVPITLCSIGAAPYCSESNLSPSPVTGEQQGLPLMNGDGLGPQLNCDPETRPDTQPGIIIFHTNNFN